MPDLGKVSTFEIAKFVNGQDLRFRIRNRRNRLLALWAASKLGLSVPAAEAYGRSIVAVGVTDRDGHGVLRQIVHDLTASGSGIGEPTVLAEADRLQRLATEDIVSASPPRHRAA